MTDPTAYIARLADDCECAITHLCGFLRGRGYRLSDPTGYTDALPAPTADPVAVLTAVWGVEAARLAIVDSAGVRAGWVYLVMPLAVGELECVADYGVNALTEAWAADYAAMQREMVSGAPDIDIERAIEESEREEYANWLDRQ